MPVYYALLLPQQVRLKLNLIRRTLYSKSGNSSFRAQESCILLGETADTSLSKLVSCPPLPLPVQGIAAYAEQTLHFPVPEEALRQIREELGVSHSYSGIYLGDEKLEYEAEIPAINDLRLALVEVERQGNLTLWRTLSEKHLQRGKEV